MTDRFQYPSLQSGHLNDARLFADRMDLIRALDLPAGPTVAEVGVAHGEFSEFLIAALRPARFVAYDLFNLHEQEFVWSYRTAELFQGKTHADFYRDRFRHIDAAFEMYAGDTGDTLDMGGGGFDLIYVDAGHEYADVKRDSLAAARKMAADGVLVFNDYVMIDHHYGAPYGVVQAVNELVADGEWKVVGLALQQQMFCDIALSRRTSPVWRS